MVDWQRLEICRVHRTLVISCQCWSRWRVQISVAGDSKSTTLIVAVAALLLSSVHLQAARCAAGGHATHPAGTRMCLGDDVYAIILADFDVSTSLRAREVRVAFRRIAWLVLFIEETNLSRSISQRIRPSVIETRRRRRLPSLASRRDAGPAQVNTNSPRPRFDYNSDGRTMTYCSSNV